jgi:LuxR family maltose regulon positive regulatory protein
LAALLSTCARRGPATGYAHRLLGSRAPVTEAVPAPRGPIEPLSTRELEVLRLLGTDLDGPGIARELFISLNTVRTHTKNVYAKLGVTNRRAAVRRAVELELLTRPHG